MKKNMFFAVLTAAVLFMAVAGFAEETAVETAAEEATDKTLVGLEIPKVPLAAETQTADKDAFNEDDFFVSETKPEPVATVSSVENTGPTASVVKAQAVAGKAVTSKIPAEPPSKRLEKAPVKSKRSPAPSDQEEMEKHWKSLFSKEPSPDSIIYVVKPGDSLYVLARKNHTTVDLIKKINGLKSDSIYPKMKLKIHTAPFSILVDKSKNTLVLYSENVPVKKYSVATGKKNSTPVGEFKITEKLLNPTWFKTGAILPPGSPENALGTRWMGFDKPAYGIHGTIEPKTIGTQASEGCIRMLNADVEELYSIVPRGTKVTIQD